ncbi:MAG: radical SAM/SPASM domain-containing protein, partial [Bacteroidales bacterium]|nr:radical SAM/SPASM domain-containing protein [Bacteroidales bacterium]
FQRFLNLSANLLSYFISSLFKKPVNIGFPASITIEPTNYCNLKCHECPSGSDLLTREKGYIDLNLYKKIIDEIHKKIIYLTLHFQGEPYSHPKIFELIKYASEKKMLVTISTNGHFLSKENAAKTIESDLDKIIISLDGTTQKSYSAYRKGGSLEKVIEGIENIVKVKNELKRKNPFVVLQFLVFSHNENEISEIKNLAKKLNVNKLEFKSAQIYDFEKGNILIPSNEKYSRYKKVGEKYFIKNKLRNKCFRLWTNPVVTWDGRVLPCCFDKDAEYKSGNLKENTFKEIWNSKSYKEFRKNILTSRKTIGICGNCTE